MSKLQVQDPEIAKFIGLELGRQRDKLEMIASENIVSEAVMEAVAAAYGEVIHI